MWNKACEVLPKSSRKVIIRYVGKNGDIAAEGSGSFNGDTGKWSITYDTPKKDLDYNILQDADLEWITPVEENEDTKPKVLYEVLDVIHSIVLEKNIGAEQPTLANGLKLWIELCEKYGTQELYCCGDMICNETEYGECPLIKCCRRCPQVDADRISQIVRILTDIYEGRQGG